MAASFEILRSLVYSSITNSGFTNVGTPFAHPAVAFDITNNTDGDMFFSIDGSNAYFFVPAGAFVLYDCSTNKNPGKSFNFPEGTQISVKYSSEPTKGSVYVEVMYSTQPGF
jgi:hypothetical protein